MSSEKILIAHSNFVNSYSFCIMNNYVEQTLKTKLYCIWSCNTTYDQQVITQQGQQLLTDPLALRMSAPVHVDFHRHPHPSMRTSAPIHADVRIDVRKDVRIDVCRRPQTSLRTTADLHMEILRMSAQKKFPACIDLRTKRSYTPQTSAGKCPQFSMRNITFFADISGTGNRYLLLICYKQSILRWKQSNQ